MVDDEGTASPASWGAPRTKTVSWHDPLALAAQLPGQAGVDAIRAMIAGDYPPPPIAQLMGFTLTEVEVGRAVFTCDPDESVYNPLGVIHGGLVCTLLDSAVGCAVHSTLPPNVSYTSIEIKVNYLRPIHPSHAPLTATGTVTKPGRRIAFADGTVHDSEGKLVATASSSLLIVPLTSSS